MARKQLSRTQRTRRKSQTGTNKTASKRVLVFPPLCSFNRLLIHKTIEINFSELATFSIGCGKSRRTVVAFQTTLERAGTDLHGMSEQNFHHGKNRGRGRGKDLTPNERVAQWVNQREARRLNKERWSSRGQSNTQQEEICESSMGVLHKTQDTDEVNEKEKARSKRAPQTQLYIPPSLRQKKGQSPPLNDGHDRGSTFLNQTHPTDSSGTVLYGMESKPLPSNQSKGRGRGRRKPEVEVYVPRALRAAQIQQDKDTASSHLLSGDSKFNSIDQKVFNSSKCSPILKENEICQSIISVNKESSLAESNPICDFEDRSSKDTNENVYSPVSASTSEEKVKIQTNTSEISETAGDTTVLQKLKVSDDNGFTLNGPYTFEFYDPAVVAFMPASPLPQDTNKNVSNHSNEDSSCKSTEFQGNLFCSISDQVNESKEEFAFNSSSKSQDRAIKTLSDAEFSSSSEVNMSIPMSLALQDETEVKLQQTEIDSKLLHKAESSVETEHLKSSESMMVSASHDSQNMEDEQEKEEKDALAVHEEDTEDSWDTMFDDNGDCLDESLMDELIKTVGKVEVTKPKINYLKYEPKEPDMNMQALGHVVEIYDFSPELATHDIISAFRDFASRGFDVKWVDDTHALGVFSNAVAANEALCMIHPLLKTRPMSQASKQSQSKARHCQEFLQPYKARPQTTSIAARRLVAGALGMTPRVSREMRDKEKQKLKEAKEKRRQEKQQKIDIWDGSFGKCAMDEV